MNVALCLLEGRCLGVTHYSYSWRSFVDPCVFPRIIHHSAQIPGGRLVAAMGLPLLVLPLFFRLGPGANAEESLKKDCLFCGRFSIGDQVVFCDSSKVMARATANLSGHPMLAKLHAQ